MKVSGIEVTEAGYQLLRILFRHYVMCREEHKKTGKGEVPTFQHVAVRSICDKAWMSTFDPDVELIFKNDFTASVLSTMHQLIDLDLLCITGHSSKSDTKTIRKGGMVYFVCLTGKAIQGLNDMAKRHAVNEIKAKERLKLLNDIWDKLEPVSERTMAGNAFVFIGDLIEHTGTMLGGSHIHVILSSLERTYHIQSVGCGFIQLTCLGVDTVLGNEKIN